MRSWFQLYPWHVIIDKPVVCWGFRKKKVMLPITFVVRKWPRNMFNLLTALFSCAVAEVAECLHDFLYRLLLINIQGRSLQ